jgi:hypothetical protein
MLAAMGRILGFIVIAVIIFMVGMSLGRRNKNK